MAWKTLLFFYLLLSPVFLVAQIGKGYWLAGGQLDILSTNLGDQINNETTVSLRPRLGAFVSDRILLGGELILRTAGTNVSVGNNLFGRYYFLSHAPFHVFAGLNWHSESNRSLLAGVSSSDFIRIKEASLQIGTSYALKETVVLDLIFNYDFYGESKRTGRFRRLEETIGYFNVRLQYFWQAKGKKEEEIHKEKGWPLEKGRWMIGGHIQLGKAGPESPVNYNWWLSPSMARFITNRWAIKTDFSFGQFFNYSNFDLAGQLGSRHYLPIRHQRFFFAEPALGYVRSLRLTVKNGEDYNYKSAQLWSYGLQLGFTTFLSKHTAFEIAATYKTYRPFAANDRGQYRGAYFRYILLDKAITDFSINIGLQFLL